MGSHSLVQALNYFLPIVLLGLAVLIGLFFVIRKSLTRRLETNTEAREPHRVSDDPAFAIATFQSVIQKLREQEKELERLHQIEKQRAAESARLSESIAHSMPTGLLLVNASGLVTTCNPAAQSILRVTAPLYHRPCDLLGAASPLAEMIEDCLRRGQTFQRQEVDHTTPDGQVRRLGVSISPATRPDGAITGVTCLVTDLTEITALQKQIRLRESLARLGEMSAGIAHEFKNSLATIAGYAQMISTDAGESEVGGHAKKILGETRTLARVVAEFLSYSKPVELATQTVELRGLLEAAVKEVQAVAPAARFSIEGTFEQVEGDASLLRQAFLNLLRNAGESVAARGAKGRVVVRGEVEAGNRRVQKITFSDNGVGIPAENLDKVFLPFFTTKESGTGLGLAIVQKITLNHNGSIDASADLEGASFTLTLPLGD